LSRCSAWCWVFFIDWPPAARLGEGGAERWVAYPVVLWMVSFGSTLCRTHEPRGRPEAGVTG